MGKEKKSNNSPRKSEVAKKDDGRLTRTGGLEVERLVKTSNPNTTVTTSATTTPNTNPASKSEKKQDVVGRS